MRNEKVGWRIEKLTPTHIEIRDSNNELIWARSNKSGQNEELAQLIAAAPKMRILLEKASNHLKEQETYEEAISTPDLINEIDTLLKATV